MIVRPVTRVVIVPVAERIRELFPAVRADTQLAVCQQALVQRRLCSVSIKILSDNQKFLPPISPYFVPD